MDTRITHTHTHTPTYIHTHTHNPSALFTNEQFRKTRRSNAYYWLLYRNS